MICPICGGKCYATATTKEPDEVRRVRRCRDCGHAFATIEVDEDYLDKYREMVVAQVLELVGRR